MWDFFRRNAVLTLVLVGLPSLGFAWLPLVELKFEPGTTTLPGNTGWTGGTATLYATTPAYVTSGSAISGGGAAASRDISETYNRGGIKANVTPTLMVGNEPSNHRARGFYAPFNGLVDQVRICGSTSNSSGVLTLDQIQSLQGALALTNVPGVIYDQWKNISGYTLSALTSDPRFLNNKPSLTKLQSGYQRLRPKRESN